MADFTGTMLTAKGRNLLSKAQTGATLKFTKIKIGDGTWTANTDPTQLNDLIDTKLSLPIQAVQVVGDGTVRLRFVLTNTGLQQGFFMREIGIYAQDPDLGEILYAVAYAGDKADFIPSDGTTKVENVVDIYTVIANTQNVSAVISDTVVIATKQDVNNLNTQLTNQINTVNTQLTTQINTVNTQLTTQINTVKPELGTTAPTNIYTGKLWFNTSNNYLQYYDGSNWQNVSVFNADKVDGFDASQTPSANTIVPLNSQGILDLSTTYIKSNIYTIRRVDLSNASSDYTLQVGEEAIINFNNTSSVALHIATTSTALYWLYCSAGACTLNPNNTTYSSSFYWTDWGINYDGSNASATTGGNSGNAFVLGNPAGTGFIVSYIDVKNAKILTQHAATFSNYPYSIRHYATHWKNPVSWTSLGTITFNQSSSGYILIRRLA